jgi:hypothetical protein
LLVTRINAAVKVGWGQRQSQCSDRVAVHAVARIGADRPGTRQTKPDEATAGIVARGSSALVSGGVAEAEPGWTTDPGPRAAACRSASGDSRRALAVGGWTASAAASVFARIELFTQCDSSGGAAAAAAAATAPASARQAPRVASDGLEELRTVALGVLYGRHWSSRERR